MANTLNTFTKRKYLDELSHETPDAVLGNLMSDYGYQLHFKNIIDPCDWLHHCNYPNLKMNANDRQVIERNQPMFYNAKRHRPVNRQDLIQILNQLSN